jgi:hypothetical protein
LSAFSFFSLDLSSNPLLVWRWPTIVCKQWKVLILRSVEQERKRSKLPFIGRKSVPKKGKEEKHQDELQDVQNFDDQETHQNNVCLEGLRRRWKRIRKKKENNCDWDWALTVRTFQSRVPVT